MLRPHAGHYMQGALGVCNVRTEETCDVGMGRSGAVIGSGMVRVSAERLAGVLACCMCLQVSICALLRAS